MNKKDTDYFEFINSSEDGYMIDVMLKTKKSNPLKLAIYFQDKVVKAVYLLKNELAEGEKTIIIKGIYIPQGKYFIRITQKSEAKGEVPYRLFINKYEYALDSEAEPNDNIGEANELNLAKGYIKGYFNPEWNAADIDSKYNETDWIKFYVSEQSNLLSLELTSVPNVDSVIDLYNDLGILIKSINGFGIDEPEILKNYGVSKTGYYYAKIYAKMLGQKNDSIPYKFYIDLKGIEKDTEIEPNDSMNNANYLSNSIKGFINPIADKDWYYFNISGDKPKLLNISITPISDIDVVLNLYNSLGEKIFQINAAGKEESEVFPDYYILSGKYYISVSDSDNKNQNVNTPYKLSINTSQYKNNFEIEPNNSFDKANEIKLASSVYGYISPAKDTDCYRLDLNSDKRLKFALSPIESLRPMIEIYSNEKIINSIDQLKTGTDNYINLTKGTYYIILKDADNKGNYYERYIFTILER